MDALRFEMWKPISQKSVPGVMPGAYYVSDFGRVYSCLRNRLLEQVPTWNGYYRVALRNINKTTRYHLIHRIVMIEFNPIENYQNMQVNHINGNKEHNFLSNLEWCTCSENILHAFITGNKSQYKGEDCSYATITNEQADTIARMISEQKYTHQEIADIIGCKLNIVDNISSGSNWREYHDKYELYKYKRTTNKFSDEDLCKICEYFENNKNKYNSKSELFRHTLSDLFGLEYSNRLSTTMCRIYNHETRTDITNRYNF